MHENASAPFFGSSKYGPFSYIVIMSGTGGCYELQSDAAPQENDPAVFPYIFCHDRTYGTSWISDAVPFGALQPDGRGSS